MAKITIKIECEICLEELCVEVSADARNRVDAKSALINKAVDNGWHVKAKALCPKCKDKAIKRCKTCGFWENKGMCAPICTQYVDKPIVDANDFCFRHTKALN